MFICILQIFNGFYRLVGFCGELSSTLASVGLGAMKVLATVVSLNLVDRIGRRVALMVGLAAMGMSILTLAVIEFYNTSAGLGGEPCTEVGGGRPAYNESTLATRTLLSGESLPSSGVAVG